MKSINGRSDSTNCSRGGDGGGAVFFGRRMSLTWTLARTAPSPRGGEGGGEGVPTSRPEPSNSSITPLGEREKQAGRPKPVTAADGSVDFLTATAPASRWRQPNMLLILCVAIGVWLVLAPVAALLVTAFTEDTGLGFGAFTLDNFFEAYGSTRILRLFANSLVYALGTAVVTFLIGGFVAWAVERTDAPGRTLFHNLALLS